MKTLRTLANGQKCMVRIPGICNHDSSTTVLAHIRRAGLAGVGQKPSDLCAVWACNECHNEIDGRSKSKFTPDELDSLILGALLRQLQWYEKHQVLKVWL